MTVDMNWKIFMMEWNASFHFLNKTGTSNMMLWCLKTKVIVIVIIKSRFFYTKHNIACICIKKQTCHHSDLPWLEVPAEGGWQRGLHSISYKGHLEESRCFWTTLQGNKDQSSRGVLYSNVHDNIGIIFNMVNKFILSQWQYFGLLT